MKKTKLMICSLVVLGVFFCLIPFDGLALDCRRRSLQRAIDRASSGDTIYVTGTCNENIVIPETLSRITLDGQGMATIVGPDPKRYTVYIQGREIKIVGFTVTGGLDGIGVVRGGTARIENNIIEATARIGIGVVENSYADIIGNTIRNNPWYGIIINQNSTARIGYTSGYPTPDNPNPNTIEDNGWTGIYVTRSSNAQIVGNKILNNGTSTNQLDGITVARSSQADITGNEISGNSGNGIFVWANSGVNLGIEGGTGPLNAPNFTTNNNGLLGIKCFLGGYVDGYLGDLAGDSGGFAIYEGCIDSLDWPPSP